MSTILFALTSHDRLGDTGKTTGFFVSEAAHPYRVFRDAGHDVEFVSVAGGTPPMDGLDPEDAEQTAFLTEVADRLAATKTPTDVSATDYAAIFYVGGHGAMWDFPDNAPLAALASDIHAAGGVVAAVCHGPAGLLEIRLPDGSRLIDGRRVSGFSNEEESAVGLTDVVPFLLQDELTARGAHWVGGPMFAEHAVADRHLITGQNPASATKVAELVLTELAG